MTPQYSRSFINRVGDMIISDDVSARECEDALSVFNDWRALHLYPMNTFQSTLRNYVGQVNPRGIVAQRLKRSSTIIDKLKNRQKSMNLSQMQDIGGLRAIVTDVQSVRALEKKFKCSRTKHNLKRASDYIEKPRDSGYRGIHLIYEYHKPQIADYDGLFLEIQLRTHLQHLWATAVETAGFFFRESLKSSQGNAQRLEFFQMVSALFAIEEGQLPHPAFRQFTKREIVNNLLQLEEKHRILFHLAAIPILRSAKNEKKLKSTAYWIIRANIDAQAIEIFPFAKEQQNVANMTYGYLELRNNCNGHIVLVSVDSVTKLEKAYPSFFLNIQDFVEKVKAITAL